jgi:hypothetical protein
VVLLTSAAQSGAEDAVDVLPVADVLNRVIGAPLANQFHLVLDPTLEQGFIVTSIHDSEDNTTIRVVASGLPELGFGAAYYLRTLVSRCVRVCVCVGGGLIRYTPLPAAVLPPSPSMAYQPTQVC